MEENSYFYCFKEDVKPVWEDPANENGGAFVLRFEQAHCNKVWEDLLLAFVARNIKANPLVNGVRFKVRKGVQTVEVWVSDNSDEEELENARDWIVDSMCLNPDTSIELIKFRSE